MPAATSKILGAIEIGTTNVTCLAAEVLSGRSLNIIGMGQCSSEGVKKGEIVDFKAASSCAHAAIHGAESSADAQLEGVYLALTGGHLQGFFQCGSANVSASDGLVRKGDVQRAIADGKSKQIPAGRVLIHHIRRHFLLDGRAVAAPVEMEGDRLEVGYWSIHGDERRVRDPIHVVNGFGLTVEDVVISSVAAAAMVVGEEAKDSGVLVMDIGGGTTDWVLYRGGVVERTGVIAVAGDHLRNDIALGLRVNAKYAEKLLHEFGKAVLENDDKSEKVWMVGDQMIGDRRIPRESLIKVINARIDELFQIVKKQLGAECSRERIPAGAVITGGLARLPKIAECAAHALGLPVLLGRNPKWVREDLRGPEFSTTLGLLHFALTGTRSEDISSAKDKKEEKSLMKGLTRFFS